MKHFKAIVLMLLIVPAAAHCQLTLKGDVLNQYGNLQAGVSVTLSNSQKPLISTKTSQSGTFTLTNLSPANYTIKFSSVGYADTLISLKLAKDTLIKIRFQQSVYNLKEIQVNTPKQLIQKMADRTVFNAEKSIAGAGSDVFELIGKIPGIRVDNNTIAIVGKGSVNIMINDRMIHLSADDLANYLKSIPSDDISKVEIITNPPAKYDAQGNNGLINIILKKPVKFGLQGAINTNYSIASHPSFTGGGNINYRKKNLIIYSSFNLRDGSIASEEIADVAYPDQTWDISNRFRNYRKVASGQVGIDYQLSKSMMIGGIYNTSRTDFHSDETIITNIYNSSGNLDSALISQANARMKPTFSSANLFLKKTIDTNGKQLLINADWFTNKNDNQRHFDNNTYTNGNQLEEGSFAQYLSASNQSLNVYTVKADIDIPFKLYKLSFGGKLSFIQNTSDISFFKELDEEYVIDKGQTDNFNYSENTEALYINLNRKYGKWSVQTGLRGEYTQTKGNSLLSSRTDINRYSLLFPTTFLSYQPNQLHSFYFSYSRRINRPPYRDLNPFRWYSNQYAYTEGNPFLKPSYSNNFELSHSYKNIIISTLSYNRTNNGYSNVNFTDTLSKLQASKPLNFLQSHNYKLSNSVSFTKISWLQSNNELDFIYNRSVSSIQGIDPLLAGASVYFSTSNEFYFVNDKSFSGELSFWYQSKNVNGIQVREDQYNLNAGAKMLFLKKHVQLTLNVIDILRSNEYRYTTFINGIKQTYANYYDSRQLRISIRYLFGNEKVRQPNRQTGNTDETKRN